MADNLEKSYSSSFEQEPDQQHQKKAPAESNGGAKQEPKPKQDPEPQFESRMHIRDHCYSGRWYPKDKSELTVILNSWIDMAKCETTNIKTLKALVAP